MAKLLGVPRPITWGRQYPGKSVYVDIPEQEAFVNNMGLVLTDKMKAAGEELRRSPHFYVIYVYYTSREKIIHLKCPRSDSSLCGEQMWGGGGDKIYRHLRRCAQTATTGLRRRTLYPQTCDVSET